MPIEYRVDSGQNLLVTRATGSLTDDAIFEYLNRLVNDQSWRSGMNGIVDLLEIHTTELSGDSIKKAAEIATRHEDRFAGSRWAIIAQEDFAFGIGRMYEMRRNPDSYAVGVYREYEPALAWLDVEHPEALR